LEYQDLVLTGRIGIGKTTVLEKAVRALEKKGKRVAGILTHETVEDGKRSGFEVIDVESGEHRVLARMSAGGRRNAVSYPTGKDGKIKTLSSHYDFVQGGFDFADAVYERLLSKSPQDLIVVDELGLFESRGEGFQNAVGLIRKTNRPPMAVIVRKDILDRILPMFPGNPRVLEVNEKNRDRLPDTVEKHFLGKVR